MNMSDEEQFYSVRSLSGDLRKLGLEPGATVIVHSSLKAIGRVVGGPVSVLLAIEQTLTESGTLLMPTFSEHLCDPSENKTYPEEAREFVRDNMPLFYPDLTPVDKWNGFLTEVFRKQENVVRSSHPHVSFAAWGKQASYITEDQPLNYALGPDSPLDKLYKLEGQILLLGAPKDSITALHLAEYSVEKLFDPGKKWLAKILEDGEERWVTYIDVDNNSDIFPALLDDYIGGGRKYSTGRFGSAESYLIPVVDLVDFGVKWLRENRK